MLAVLQEICAVFALISATAAMLRPKAEKIRVTKRRRIG
jgi:hypothetical protein